MGPALDPSCDVSSVPEQEQKLVSDCIGLGFTAKFCMKSSQYQRLGLLALGFLCNEQAYDAIC